MSYNQVIRNYKRFLSKLDHWAMGNVGKYMLEPMYETNQYLVMYVKCRCINGAHGEQCDIYKIKDELVSQNVRIQLIAKFKKQWHVYTNISWELYDKRHEDEHVAVVPDPLKSGISSISEIQEINKKHEVEKTQLIADCDKLVNENRRKNLESFRTNFKNRNELYCARLRIQCLEKQLAGVESSDSTDE